MPRLEVPLLHPSAAGAYPAVVDSSTRQLYPALSPTVDGRWFGRKLVEQAPASPSLVVAILANATTGNVRLNVELAAVANVEDLDPALTANTEQTVAAPGTAYQRKDVTFTGLPTIDAGDVLLCSVFRNADDAADTLAVDLLIAGVFLSW